MLDNEVTLAAQRLMKDPATIEALRLIEDKFTTAWKQAALASDREDYWRMVRAVDELRSQIEMLAAADRVAEFNRRLRR